MNESPEISLTEHQRYWLKHVTACEASGMRITEYASEYGLAVRAMYDGKRALVKKGVTPHACRTDVRPPYPLSWDKQELLFLELPEHLRHMTNGENAAYSDIQILCVATM
jgi:hypothetical protein